MPGVGDLTVSLLETNPVEYGQILKDFASWGNASHAVKEKLNEEPYETWHSNHLFALSRLVGTLNPEAQNRDEHPEGLFYGSRNVNGIPTSQAIDLLKMMLNAGGDITAKDYYGRNVLEYLKRGHQETLFYRTGIEEYTRFVEEIYEGNSCEEGSPPEQ